MRIRRLLAATAATAALAGGLAAGPAVADSGDSGVRVTSREAASGDFQAAASWHTIDEFFFYYQCEHAALDLQVRYNWTMRCYGGGPISYWQLQRWY
ncbi:hypothetical protein [Streptomyces sp. SBT349]|uniref:hypothetical protein n=1 Tax=Streptomyces sp. SBT349 TaxID=1580539 RepID=UPI00066EA543|nr:hypothetical protein [Streptomyces sp. SBT349]